MSKRRSISRRRGNPEHRVGKDKKVDQKVSNRGLIPGVDSEVQYK